MRLLLRLCILYVAIALAAKIPAEGGDESAIDGDDDDITEDGTEGFVLDLKKPPVYVFFSFIYCFHFNDLFHSASVSIMASSPHSPSFWCLK